MPPLPFQSNFRRNHILFSMKLDEFFSIKTKSNGPKCKSKKIKLTPNLHLQKESEVSLKNWPEYFPEKNLCKGSISFLLGLYI